MFVQWVENVVRTGCCGCCRMVAFFALMLSSAQQWTSNSMVELSLQRMDFAMEKIFLFFLSSFQLQLSLLLLT